jgi:uncharacterized protein YbjT (DUF2867 family)
MSGRVAVIAGGSGLVGGRCLHHLLVHPEVARVAAIVRRPLGLTPEGHEKLVELRLDDLTSEAKLDDVMPKDIDDAYCALGTTMKKAGSREAFLKVDKTAVLAFAKVARAHGARRFLLVSSIGADARSMNFYLRTKGEVQDALKGIGYDVVHVLQPSILDGDRPESRPAEKLGLALSRALAPVLGKYAPIHVDVVGRAMVRLAFREERGYLVHGSKELQAIGA